MRPKSDIVAANGLAPRSQNTEEGVHFFIRKASIDDLDEIVSIWLEGQAGVPESQRNRTLEQIRDFYRPHLESESVRFGIWVAEADDESGLRTILGWQALLPCRPHPLFEERWAQSSTYISHTNRTRGVGRSLLSFACEAAVDLGLSYIIGFIRVDNAAPIKMVEDLDWKKVGTMPTRGIDEVGQLIYAYAVPERNTK